MRKVKKLRLILILLSMSAITYALSSSYNYKIKDRIKNSNQFDGKKFVNAELTKMGGLSDMGKMIKAYRASKDIEKTPLSPIPVVKTDLDKLSEKSDSYRIIWLGHAGFILEMDGKRVLVDGVFAKRASLVSFMGPKRFHDTPISLNDLPELDAILFSHDHYDHMDKSLAKHFKDSRIPFIAPLGVGEHLRDWGIAEDRIFELDWYEEVKLGELTIIAGPGRHFTGRGLTDRNETLWASLIFKGSKESVFYSGDTGYTEVYKELGEKYGPFKVSLMQIGAYNKLWEDIHLFPEDAIKMHEMLKAETLIPVHWGTFNLAMHSWHEPVDRLLEDGNKKNIKMSFPKVGEIVDSTNIHTFKKWWKQ